MLLTYVSQYCFTNTHNSLYVARTLYLECLKKHFTNNQQFKNSAAFSTRLYRHIAGVEEPRLHVVMQVRRRDTVCRSIVSPPSWHHDTPTCIERRQQYNGCHIQRQHKRVAS